MISYEDALKKMPKPTLQLLADTMSTMDLTTPDARAAFKSLIEGIAKDYTSDKTVHEMYMGILAELTVRAGQANPSENMTKYYAFVDTCIMWKAMFKRAEGRPKLLIDIQCELFMEKLGVWMSFDPTYYALEIKKAEEMLFNLSKLQHIADAI